MKQKTVELPVKMKYITTLFLYFFSLHLSAQNCEPNFTGLVPIADLGNDKYNGFIGGKYPDGSNYIPLTHFEKGISLAKTIAPLNSAGVKDTNNGKIGFMVLGYSTAAMTGRFLKTICKTHPLHNKLEIIIGAQGGKDINSMTLINSGYYKTIDTILSEQKITAEQIQIIWISSGDIITYDFPFPEHCNVQLDKYRLMLINLNELYPNLKIIYLSDRPYAGYIGGTGEGPMELKEPTAYYSSWTIKWLIEKQINSTLSYTYADIPFIDWGPMLWTDGSNGNKLNYTWDCNDAGKGGIHASSKGRMKEAGLCWWWWKKCDYFKAMQ